MTLKRDPSKALQIGFLVLLLISTVQVGYWMYDHVQSARAVERRFVTEYRSDAAALSELAPGDAARAAARLPHLTVEGAHVDVRPGALAELADERAGRI